MTVNSPDRLDFTEMLPKEGSIDASTPMMLEMVAVGAMATQLELRIPWAWMRARSGTQSNLLDRSTCTY